jgi:NifU-like protein involved in Fe-S cluster formation
MSTYSQAVWQNFHEPKNVGRLENPDGEGFAGRRRAGPFFRLTARLEGDRLSEVRFQTYGCAPAIAAGSVLSEAIRGKTLGEAGTWNLERLLAALGGLPDDKMHCAELAMEALRGLVAELTERRKAAEGNFFAG